MPEPVHSNATGIFGGIGIEIPVKIKAALIVSVIVQENELAGYIRAVNIFYHIAALVLPRLRKVIHPQPNLIPELVAHTQKVHIAQTNYAHSFRSIITKRTTYAENIAGNHNNIYTVGRGSGFVYRNARILNVVGLA